MRPPKKGLDYFPHDTDAFNDEKIEAIRMKHGAEGYMFYFFHLERIYRSENAEIVSDAETQQILSRKLEITPQKYTEILNTCIKYKCFDPHKYTQQHLLTSNGIRKRASVVYDKRKRMKDLYNKNISDAETQQKHSSNSSETYAESTQRKEKKRRGEIKGKIKGKIKGNKIPTLLEIEIYIKERNLKNVTAKAFFDYFTIGNWIDSKGNPVLNWKQKLLTWEGRNYGQTRGSKQPLACEKETPEGKYANIPTEIIDNTL